MFLLTKLKTKLTQLFNRTKRPAPIVRITVAPRTYTVIDVEDPKRFPVECSAIRVMRMTDGVEVAAPKIIRVVTRQPSAAEGFTAGFAPRSGLRTLHAQPPAPHA